MDEFLKQLLDAIKDGSGKLSELQAADFQRQVANDGMLDVIKLGLSIDMSTYSKVDETTHAMLSVITAVLQEQSNLLRVLIDRLPPKVDTHLPPKPKVPPTFPPFAGTPL